MSAGTQLLSKSLVLLFVPVPFIFVLIDYISESQSLLAEINQFSFIYLFFIAHWFMALMLGSYMLFLPDQKMRQQKKTLLFLLLLTLPFQLIFFLFGSLYFLSVMVEILEPSRETIKYATFLDKFGPVPILGMACLLFYQLIRLCVRWDPNEPFLAKGKS